MTGCPPRGAAADALAAIATHPGRDRTEATVGLARGRIARAAGDADAVNLLQHAVNAFAQLGLRLEVAQTRLELAHALAPQSPAAAIETARHARNELEALGATRDADAAAALMRSLGARGRAGPRSLGSLSSPGGRGATPRRRGALQPGHRVQAVHQPEDGRAPRRPDLREARSEVPRRSGRLRRPQSRGRNRGFPPTERGHAARCWSHRRREHRDVRAEQADRPEVLRRGDQRAGPRRGRRVLRRRADRRRRPSRLLLVLHRVPRPSRQSRRAHRRGRQRLRPLDADGHTRR